jgi:hypothetical protein
VATATETGCDGDWVGQLTDIPLMNVRVVVSQRLEFDST